MPDFFSQSETDQATLHAYTELELCLAFSKFIETPKGHHGRNS